MPDDSRPGARDTGRGWKSFRICHPCRDPVGTAAGTPSNPGATWRASRTTVEVYRDPRLERRPRRHLAVTPSSSCTHRPGHGRSSVVPATLQSPTQSPSGTRRAAAAACPAHVQRCFRGIPGALHPCTSSIQYDHRWERSQATPALGGDIPGARGPKCGAHERMGRPTTARVARGRHRRPCHGRRNRRPTSPCEG